MLKVAVDGNAPADVSSSVKILCDLPGKTVSLPVSEPNNRYLSSEMSSQAELSIQSIDMA